MHGIIVNQVCIEFKSRELDLKGSGSSFNVLSSYGLFIQKYLHPVAYRGGGKGGGTFVSLYN